MSWLDFANHFLSNQRLHAWSWINRTFSWEWCFFCWNFGFECFWPFPFLFLFSVGRKSHWHTGFWLAIKGRGPLGVVVSFLFFRLLGDNSVLLRYCLVPRPFCIFLLWSGTFFFFFFFLSIFDRGIFFLFCFLPLFDWEFSLFAFFRFFWSGIFSFSLFFCFLLVCMLLCNSCNFFF